jgi:hypothetical protein
MKRKFVTEEIQEEKRSRADGCFSVLRKRKHTFEAPTPKRLHQYNVIEEKDRYITKLEDAINQMALKISELEYQLQITRTMCDKNIHRNNLIESF